MTDRGFHGSPGHPLFVSSTVPGRCVDGRGRLACVIHRLAGTGDDLQFLGELARALFDSGVQETLGDGLTHHDLSI